MVLVVVNLAQRPDLVRTVAHWQWQEWGRKQGRRLQSVAREVAKLTDPHAPEAGFVLLDNAVPVGTACLTVIDLDTRQRTMVRYLENRAASARKEQVELASPRFEVFDPEKDFPAVAPAGSI